MKSMFDPDRRYHHPDFDKKGLEGWRAVHREATLPQAAWQAERERAVRMGLPAAESIEDRSISTFARGELPHYAGINTFLKAPYVEDVRDAGKYTRRSSAHPSTAAPRFGPAPALGRKPFAGFPRSTRPIISRSASICASR